MSELTDKVAIVTGAASGIGRAGARAFAAAGARVVVADINETNGRAVVEELGTEISLFQRVDVRDVIQVQRMAANTVRYSTAMPVPCSTRA